jgi:hypothetical protein
MKHMATKSATEKCQSIDRTSVESEFDLGQFNRKELQKKTIHISGTLKPMNMSYFTLMQMAGYVGAASAFVQHRQLSSSPRLPGASALRVRASAALVLITGTEPPALPAQCQDDNAAVKCESERTDDSDAVNTRHSPHIGKPAMNFFGLYELVCGKSWENVRKVPLTSTFREKPRLLYLARTRTRGPLRNENIIVSSSLRSPLDAGLRLLPTPYRMGRLSHRMFSMAEYSQRLRRYLPEP